MWIDRVLRALEPSHLVTFSVQFSPGARTAWHRCPYGRVLHFLYGVGRVQRRGGPVHEVRAGDTIIAAAGEWQWHGAAPNTFMAVVSTHETGPDGTDTEWAERVTDAEYLLPPLNSTVPRQGADRVAHREACW
ncbi:cupin domain-containing protein [Dactylosporangium sp. NBC_01737]|uniref:cupin domain-containing protein n=1 Tax=Dactylosporangium sp. NBC_01737 TaxID=2975959 RepID=UPI002E118473|nr:cupin domain-containing protein [Dactylosporangium sp. NBC_01737]